MQTIAPGNAGRWLDHHHGLRFWAHVNLSGGQPYLADRLSQLDEASGDCWVWTGWSSSAGYGRFRVHGRPHQAHRVSYLDSGRELPSGLDLDHLCRNTRCVNPDHLEPVTDSENMRRGSRYLANREKCLHGHALTPDNIAIRSRSGKQVQACRTCLADSRHRNYLRRKARDLA